MAPCGDLPQSSSGFPRFRRPPCVHDVVHDPGASERHSPSRAARCCLRPWGRPRLAQLHYFVAPYTPCTLAVYASPRPLPARGARLATGRLVRAYPGGTLTRWTSPASPGARPARVGHLLPECDPRIAGRVRARDHRPPSADEATASGTPCGRRLTAASHEAKNASASRWTHSIEGGPRAAGFAKPPARLPASPDGAGDLLQPVEVTPRTDATVLSRTGPEKLCYGVRPLGPRAGGSSSTRGIRPAAPDRARGRAVLQRRHGHELPGHPKPNGSGAQISTRQRCLQGQGSRPPGLAT